MKHCGFHKKGAPAAHTNATRDREILMKDSSISISRAAALDSARVEFEVAHLVHVYLPSAGVQINRHLHDCWQILLTFFLLNQRSEVEFQPLSLHEKLDQISAEKRRVLQDILGDTWRDKLEVFLNTPTNPEFSTEMLAATGKIIAAITRNLDGESRIIFFRFTDGRFR